MRIRIFSILLLAAALLAGCIHTRSLGDLNLASAKNINMAAPGVELLSSAQEMSKKQVKKAAKAETLEQAVTEATNRVPGGVCMGNLQIFYVSRFWRHDCIVVNGDVWGVPGGDFQGYRSGDAVIYMASPKKALNAKIVAFKDNTVAVVSIDGGETKEVPIANLRKP